MQLKVAHYPTASKMNRALSAATQEKSLVQQKRLFLSALQLELERLKRGIPDLSPMQETDRARKYRQLLPASLFNKQQMEEAYKDFQKIAEKTLRELNTERRRDATATQDVQFLCVIDFLDRINLNVFGHYALLGDTDMRRLADMIIAGVIGTASLEKAVEHLHSNIYRASLDTGKYLSEAFEHMEPSEISPRLKALKARLQSESVIWNQKLVLFSLLIEKQFSALQTGMSADTGVTAEVCDVFNHALNGANYRLKTHALYETLQRSVEKIDLWEIHAGREEIFFTLLKYIYNLLDKGHFFRLPAFESSEATMCDLVEIMADKKRVSAHGAQKMESLIPSYSQYLDSENEEFLLAMAKVDSNLIPILKRLKKRAVRETALSDDIDRFLSELRKLVLSMPDNAGAVSRFSLKYEKMLGMRIFLKLCTHLEKAANLIPDEPDSSSYMNNKNRKDEFKEKLDNLYEFQGLRNKLFDGFQKTADELLKTHLHADEEQFTQIVNCLDTLRIDIWGGNLFFSDEFLLNLANRMTAKNMSEGFYKKGIQWIDSNIYNVSDETANKLLQKLENIRDAAFSSSLPLTLPDESATGVKKSRSKKIPKIIRKMWRGEGSRANEAEQITISPSPPFPELDALKTRLEKFPDAKIPQIFKWIWRGGEWRTNTIEQMIKFHEMNPGHRLIAYSFDPENVYAAMDKYAKDVPKGERAREIVCRTTQVTELKRVLEICDKNVLNEKKISAFLRESDNEEFSTLDAIAQRNVDKTATKPNYAVITDMERLAVLHEEGGIYVDHNCIPLLPISDNARAEMHLAAEVAFPKPHFQIVNNAILAAPKDSIAVRALLESINFYYDRFGNIELEDELPNYSGVLNEIDHKYKQYLQYRSHIQGEEAGAAQHPLTWTVGRFTYTHILDTYRDVWESNSRIDVTVNATGAGMINRVMSKHWHVSNKNQEELRGLFIQAGGAFINNFIIKPNAPAYWSGNAPAPIFAMDDTRLPIDAERKAKIFVAQEEKRRKKKGQSKYRQP